MNNIATIKELKIERGQVWLDNENYFTGETEVIGPFLKSLYKHLGLKYSKYFKIDYLSKLGLLATEILFEGEEIENESDNLAIVFANRSSSLNTDINYQESIKEIPSPSVFVYTLPNIVIGEISIKWKLYGEHMFFIHDKYDKEQLLKYTSILFETTQTDKAIVGWMEVDGEGNYLTVLSLCVKKDGIK